MMGPTERRARYVDDIKRQPVDRVARRVTSAGPKWCTPEPSDIPVRPGASVVTSRGTCSPEEFIHSLTTDPLTSGLFAQLGAYKRDRLVAAFQGRRAYVKDRVAVLRYLLGRPTTSRQAARAEALLGLGSP